MPASMPMSFPWSAAILLAVVCVSLPACESGNDASTRAAQTDAAPNESAPNDPAPRPGPTQTAISAYASQVLTQTNEQRASNGLAALTWNDKLGQAAQAYAEWMARDGFFDHNGPDGSTPGDRISATGYTWTTYGENIAYGYASPDAVMTGWMNSSGHRANILSSGYAEIGIGYAVSTGGTAYWVQDFGRSH